MPPHPEESNVYERKQIGVITEVKFLLDDKNQPTDVFSGFVSVQLLTSLESFDWVRWSNPLISQNNGYGIIACPSEADVVEVMFDPRGFPIISGMMLYSQAAKPAFNQQDFGVLNPNSPKESDDVRLKLKKGELMVRGKNGSSIHFRNDGTTILKSDDTKADADTTVIGMDSNKNVFILGAQNVTVKGSETASVTCKNAEITADQNVSVKATDAKIEASNVEVVSDNISLGKTGQSAALIRSTDKCQHIDPITGLPVISELYITQSKSTKAT